MNDTGEHPVDEAHKAKWDEFTASHPDASHLRGGGEQAARVRPKGRVAPIPAGPPRAYARVHRHERAAPAATFNRPAKPSTTRHTSHLTPPLPSCLVSPLYRAAAAAKGAAVATEPSKGRGKDPVAGCLATMLLVPVALVAGLTFFLRWYDTAHGLHMNVNVQPTAEQLKVRTHVPTLVPLHAL
jgi:hypothetical protein